MLLKYLEAAQEPEDRELYARIWDEYRSREYFTPAESKRLLQNTRNILEKEGQFLSGRVSPLWLWARRAAVFAGLLIACVALLLLLQMEEKQEFTTSYEETRNIELPDGTEVTLNANSSIHFHADWESKADGFEDPPRQVWLKGEAFFSVKHLQNGRKFIVHTDDLDVEVLGTTFNVNSRRSKTKVVLNSGKVKLNAKHADQQELVMKPGELAEFSSEEWKFIKENVDAEIYTSWKNKLLVFDDTPIHKIVQMMEDIYGYQVTLSDPALGDMVFSATVRSDDMETFLTLLARSCNVKIEKDNKKLMIKENR